MLSSTSCTMQYRFEP